MKYKIVLLIFYQIIFYKYNNFEKIEVNIDEEDLIIYTIKNFSKDSKESIEFFKEMLNYFYKYYDEVKDLVNKYTKTFKFEEMDFIDRALFIIAYIEYIRWVPKAVILNNVINLAKIYWDIWSYKLINGIWHYILN